jgi:hypothetical protein
MTKITIDQIGTLLTPTFKRMAESIPSIMQIVAKDAQALVRGRIQEEGEDYQNKRLPPYSETEVPAFFYYRKATTEAGRNIVIQRQKEKRGVSYKDFKSANNGAASVEVTNLTFTGDMWRQFQIIKEGDVGGNYVVTLGGKTKGSDNKIGWNSERYGDILMLAKEEEELLDQTFDDELQRVIDENDK